MADVDAIAKLIELGVNGVFLMLLWRVYQDFLASVNRHANFLEKLTEQLMPEDEQPQSQTAQPRSFQAWQPRATDIPERIGGD